MACAVHEGAILPPEAELRRLGLDIKNILNQVKEVREVADNGRRIEYKARNLPLKTNKCIASHWTVDSWDQAQLVEHCEDPDQDFLDDL
jgi:hypothetical protein